VNDDNSMLPFTVNKSILADAVLLSGLLLFDELHIQRDVNLFTDNEPSGA